MMATFAHDILHGKTAFITGGSSGICFGIASKFIEHSAKVMILGRNQEKLDAAVQSLRATGGTAEGFAADVRNYAALEEAMARTRELFGEIDILICGAAGNFPAPIMGMSANGFKAVVDIDLLGTYNTCRSAYPHLRKPGASIISISANHATHPYAFQAHVCAAKAGVDLLTKTAALEWGREGIRANIITPGPIDGTDGIRRLAPTAEAREAAINSVPLRRLGTVEDIANLALFLSSDAASYITGAVYACDGGQGMMGSRDLGAALQK
jgi:NAD(P)-dependent dehydrogenase (short-subunit alcohol dehydrogenase family)